MGAPLTTTRATTTKKDDSKLSGVHAWMMYSMQSASVSPIICMHTFRRPFEHQFPVLSAHTTPSEMPPQAHGGLLAYLPNPATFAVDGGRETEI